MNRSVPLAIAAVILSLAPHAHVSLVSTSWFIAWIIGVVMGGAGMASIVHRPKK